jgi:hypothetical protein
MKIPHFTRALLLPLRVLRAEGKIPFDPHSPEYLYMVQQSKRASLVRTLDRFGSKNVLLWPGLFLVILVKWVDLVLSNALVGSLINEYDLLQRIARQNGEKL